MGYFEHLKRPDIHGPRSVQSTQGILGSIVLKIILFLVSVVVRIFSR